MAQMSESSRRSCLECHRRKIKCDKCVPCSYCAKVRIECRYPPARQPKEKQIVQERININLNADVVSRIERIERTLESFERSLSHISQIVLSSPPSQPLSQGNAGLQRQKESEGICRFIQCDPPSSPFNRLFEANPLNTPTSMDLSLSTESATPATIIFSLWQRFLERVDPVLKVTHVPTVQQKIMDIVRAQGPASIEFQALMGSICYSAVVAMSVDECRREFGKEKEDILSWYRATVENSLTLANFLHSTDMTVLQAFTIYIVCGRFDKKGPDVKNLVPVAVDIAQKNGLNKIDSDSTLSPFENEMRRRIWWQLYTLDVRNAEDHDLEPCILEHSATTKLPRSINDINLHPAMNELPRSSSERTEMLFTLDRHEISTLVRRILFSDKFCQQNSYPILSVSEKCDEIDRFRARIEDQMLSLCNQDIPIDFITATSSRLILAKLKLSMTKPKTRQNQHIITQNEFRRTCVEILKNTRALRLYQNGKQWLWLFQTYLEWDALANLFINLSLVPSGDTVDSAWEAAQDIYDYWKSHSEVVFDGRWNQIEGLRSQALLAKQMYRDNPALFGESQTDDLGSRSESTGKAHYPQPTDAMDAQESPQGMLAEACANILEPNTGADPLDVPVPTTGTACQWSAALFERYFQGLDMEHNTEIPWL